jgi:hypothetical protein
VATVTLAERPWPGTDLVAHKTIELHWEDNVELGAGETNHQEHFDRVLVKDDADRVVEDGWAQGPPTTGGKVHMLYRIDNGLREGLYTVEIYVNEATSATTTMALPVTHSGEGVAPLGDEYRLEITQLLPGTDTSGTQQPLVGGQQFAIAFVLQNHGPSPCPSNRKVSVKIAGSGGSHEGETDTPNAIEAGASALLQYTVLPPGLPAGVYRVEVWADLITTMSPVSATADFTIAEAPVV